MFLMASKIWLNLIKLSLKRIRVILMRFLLMRIYWGFYGVSDHVKLNHEQGRDEAFKIWWILSEKNHPQACDELIKISNQYTLTQVNITATDLLDKQLRCVDVALQHDLKSYSRYADLLLFELKKMRFMSYY